MTEKQGGKKGLIIGSVIAGIAAVVAITVGVILTTQQNIPAVIDESYFVSDNSKYVITVDDDTSTDDDSAYGAVKTHMVFFYSGDTITGLTFYYEFADDSVAASVYEEAKQSSEVDNLDKISLHGKYIAAIADESEYADTTVAEVKQMVELMNTLNNSNTTEENNE